MNYQCSFAAIEPAIRYIEQELYRRRIDSKTRARTLLSSEELLRAVIEHAESEETELSVKLIRSPLSCEVRISAKGSAFDVSAVEEGLLIAEDEESAAVLRHLFERVMDENVSVRNRRGLNTAVIRVTASRYRQLVFTIGALFLGLLVGFIMKGVLPEAISSAVTQNLFAPVNTMFLNALKMVVAPLVLFSIASSIAEFGDMKALGRIAGKVIGSYFITSFLAILLGVGVYMLFPIGNSALQSAVTDAASATIAKGAEASTSVKDTIVGIIPSDIVNPFLKADMLQIIFIAVMLGLAVGTLGNKLRVFHDVLSDCYAVFSKITAMIIRVMPVAIFCSMAKMVLSMEASRLLSVFAWIPTVYFADVLMLCVYALIILLVVRLNPLTFFRKFSPTMLTAFTFASSNATLPSSMESCDRRLGISKRIYSFTLPLGATINMDGGCITQMISALFMAKTFGVPITGSVILSLVLEIFVLSVGAPGVPGGALVCISILLPQIGVPAEAISLIMGLYSIVDMMQTCVNVTGDATVTLAVARSEKLIDLDVFRA